MGLLRLLVTGAAVAAAVQYITKKRPNGSSVAEDLKRKFPDWMNKAQPYIDRLKGQFSKVRHMKGNAADNPYPRKFENFSPDPDPAYSS
jgi:hypothetical protein